MLWGSSKTFSRIQALQVMHSLPLSQSGSQNTSMHMCYSLVVGKAKSAHLKHILVAGALSKVVRSLLIARSTVDPIICSI